MGGPALPRCLTPLRHERKHAKSSNQNDKEPLTKWQRQKDAKSPK